MTEIKATPETIRAVAAALGRARLFDDKLGGSDEGRIAAWSEAANPHKLSQDDMLAAVTAFYADESGRAMQVADLIRLGRQIRRERDAETGPTPEYQALCESKFATYETALAHITRRTGHSVGQEIGS